MLFKKFFADLQLITSLGVALWIKINVIYALLYKTRNKKQTYLFTFYILH